MKKVVINNIDDVEKLYQIFKKKMIKNYKDKKSASEGGPEMTEWLMEKTGINKATAEAYLINFSEVLMEDRDIEEWL